MAEEPNTGSSLKKKASIQTAIITITGILTYLLCDSGIINHAP